MPGLNETNYEAEIQELENDKEFSEKISRIDSISEAAAAFREKGFDISDEDFAKAAEKYNENGDELSDAQLEQVSGGCIGFALLPLVTYLLWRRYRR